MNQRPKAKADPAAPAPTRAKAPAKIQAVPAPARPAVATDPDCPAPDPDGNPERAARCLQAIGHPVRLLILHALRGGEQSVNHLVEATGAGQANVSQHLRVMRDREILSARKDGNNVLYRVADPRVFAIINAVQEVFCKHE